MRISAPSSARMFASTRSAIRSSAAGSTSPTSSWATRLRRIVRRVARSGGRTSHTRPASKRSRSRSSSASRSRGGRSEVEHELRARLVQRVEGVEELLLGLGLALQELDVVDEQDVDAAVGGLERLQAAALERADEVVGERLDRRVAGGQAGAVLVHVVGDRVQEVGLAEPGRAADEERVVGQARHLGHRQRRGVGEPVAVADHELVEREARVELLRDRGALGLGAGTLDLDAAARARRSPRARPGRSTVSARAPSRRVKRVSTHERTSSGASSTSVVPASSRKPTRSSQMCQVVSLTARRASVRKRCQIVAGSGSDTGAAKDLLGESRGSEWAGREGPRTARSANIAKGPGAIRRAPPGASANRVRM